MGSLTCTIISSVNHDTLTPSFPTCIALISFSHLITLDRTPSNVLNGYRESGKPSEVTQTHKSFLISGISCKAKDNNVTIHRHRQAVTRRAQKGTYGSPWEGER